MTSVDHRTDSSVEEFTTTLSSAIDGRIHLLASYDNQTFRPQYVGEEYADSTVLDALGSYVGLDFVEHELFTDALFPGAKSVEVGTVRMDTRQFVAVYGDRDAVLAVVDSGERTDAVVESLQRIEEAL